MFESEDSSSEDVVKNLLRLTDINLQNVRLDLSVSGGHDGRVEWDDQKKPDRLTLQDLQTADGCTSQSDCVYQERPFSRMTERRAATGSLSPPSSKSWSNSVTARSVEMEPISSRKKAGSVRQENACLTMQGELPFTSQVSLRGPRLPVKSSVVVMSEQIHQLQAQLEARARELKTAELRAECSQEAAAHSEIVVVTLTEELNALREELDAKTAVGKRAEQQRNQALQNAEKLKEAFKDYKSTISIKLKRVMESESKLKESLIECDREKEELEMKCAVLEGEKVEQSQIISQLKEDVSLAKSVAAGLQAQLEETSRKASHLEQQLMERGAEVASLRKELEDFRTLSQRQEQQVAQSRREAQQGQAELAGLEAILTLLHLREGAVGSLCARPCMLPPVDYSASTHLLNLKPGEGYQQLLRAMQSTEAERTKQNNLVERLQERLSRAQEEISSLQSTMDQRASHYQSLHTELLDKVSQATDTEKQLKRKSARVASLEKQLQEKTSAYSQSALTNTVLENQLLEKTGTIQHYQSLMAKRQKEYQQSLEECKNSQAQQFMEHQHRINMLQSSVEEAQSRGLEMERELSLLHGERDNALEAAQRLQISVDQLTQQKQAEVKHREELAQSFKEQAAQSAAKVCELQASLSACREEVNLYLQQMEEVKKNYESELQKNNDMVASLQEELHSASLVFQSTSEQNLQLQLSLEQQQTMLGESTAHISELEESQSQLQTQVSSLEQQLERVRASLQEEVRSREQHTQEKDKDLQEMSQQNAQLSESVSHLTSEMTKCRVELRSKESELLNLRKDVALKTCQISRLEESLQHMKSQLDSKTDMVLDLEETLHRCETDKLNCLQRVQMLEGQLQAVRGELADTLEQLQELRDLLQRTQTFADEQQASVEKLTVQLSETQRELEERTHEVLDMDNALKERQGELQQRAKLLGQLDVAIREHKQEMERKVESLQQSLEARESELRDTQRELTHRNTKESQELGQVLACQQKLQTLLQELEETQHRCEALTRELNATKLHIEEKEVRLSAVEEELTLKEAHWRQLEAGLQSTVASLELEMEMEKEQHSKELESLQQTRGQLLKVSEQMSSTMRNSQEQLAAKLQQSENQLEEVKTQHERTKTQLDQAKTELDCTRKQVILLQTQRDQTQALLLQSKAQLEQSRTLCEQIRAQNNHLHAQLEQLSTQLHQARLQGTQLQAQLQAAEKSMETSDESLLIKESEVTRLQARLSSLERAADRQYLYGHSLSFSAPHLVTHSSECPPSAPSPLSSPQKPHTAVLSSNCAQSTGLLSPTRTRGGSSATPYTDHQPTSAPHLADPSESVRECDWLQSSSIMDSSLELPLSLKATLRDALSKHAWESSSPSVSSFPDSVDHSWQGLSTTNATATSDLSFNPLTYMVDKQDNSALNMEVTLMQEGADDEASESRRESVSTLVGGEEDAEMSSLTGMLKFVNQTLAMQENPSLWSSTGLSEPGCSLTVQGDV